MAHFTHIIKLHRGLLAMIISSRQKTRSVKSN